MSDERLSGLAVMKLHRSRSVDYAEIVRKFAAIHPRRLMMANPMVDT